MAVLLLCCSDLRGNITRNDLVAGDVELKGVKSIRFGIDIKGGVSATFKPADENVKPTAEQLDSARTIIETRLDEYVGGID